MDGSDMDREQARQVLLDACVNDFADSLAADRRFRQEVACNGFGGFRNLSDAELVRAAEDAALREWHWRIAEAIDFLKERCDQRECDETSKVSLD